MTTNAIFSGEKFEIEVDKEFAFLTYAEGVPEAQARIQAREIVMKRMKDKQAQAQVSAE